MATGFSTILSNLFIFLSILCNLCFVILSLSSNLKSRINLLFSSFNIFFIGWLITLYIYYQTDNLKILNITGRLNYIFIILAVALFYHFILDFPEVNIKKYKLFQSFDFIFTFIILFLVTFTPFVSVREVFIKQSPVTVFGPLYILYIGYFLTLVLIAFYILIKKYIIVQGNKRTQVIYLLAGIFSASIVGISTNIIFPYIFNIFDFQVFGPIATVILAGTFFYTIIKHRFLDIRVIIGNIIYIFTLSIVNFSFIYSFYYGEKWIFGTITSRTVIEINILMSIFYITTFVFASGILKKLFKDTIINISYDPIKVIDAYINSINEIITQDALIEVTIQVLETTFQPNRLYVIYSPSSKMKLFHGKSISVEELQELSLKFPKTKSNILLQDETQDQYLIGFMSKYDIEVMAKQGSTMLLFGGKSDKSSYSTQDLNVIRNIILSFNTSSSRVSLHEKVIDFNRTLEEKIREATSELEEKNLLLQEAYNKSEKTARQERDMLDIMGHELRTPATVIKMASYLLDPQITSENGKKQIKRIKDSIERQIQLINTFINTAKIENNKIELMLGPLELSHMLHEAIEDHTNEAIEKGLQINCTIEEGVDVIADGARIREVLDNLITNAIKYTQRGYINILCKKDNLNALIQVEDTGEGIKQEDIGLLFEKFRRVNNYTPTSTNDRMVRPGGTGLGLYVSKGIVELHNGKIWVTSEFGKGSIFSFSIPLATPQEIEKYTKDPKFSSANMFNKYHLKRENTARIEE